MNTSIDKINELVEELKGLLPMQPENQQLLDKKMRLEFNYNSNHIEGNTLTYGETELLLIFGKTTGNHEIREYDEMKAHDAAFELVKEWAGDDERPLTEMALKNLHKIILVEPFWKEAILPDGQPTRRLIKVGDYKEHSNSVRLQNGEMFHYASPSETPIQMGELIQWHKDEEVKQELHPVALAALLHYKFVLIHPFDDGNGRISRLLMNYVLLKHHLPPIIVKSADKKSYLFALNQADTGNIEAFVEYISEQLLWSLELYIKAAKGEDLEEKGDLEKEIALWKKKLVIQQTGTLRRNDGLVYQIYKNGGKELLESFAEQHEQFFELFHKIGFNFFLQDFKNIQLETVSDKLNKRTLIKDSVFQNKPISHAHEYEAFKGEQSNDTFEFLFVNIDMKEYKYNEKNPFFINSNLTINFQPYNYLVLYNNKPIIEKKYGKYLIIDEINQILSDCIKYVFNQIKINDEK